MTISEFNRMTPERFGNCLTQHGYELDPDYFADLTVKLCCPVGMLVIEKIGETNATLLAGTLNTVATASSCISSGDVAASLATFIGIDADYGRGLDDGVQNKTMSANATNNYYIGYHDGVSIKNKFGCDTES